MYAAMFPIETESGRYRLYLPPLWQQRLTKDQFFHPVIGSMTTHCQLPTLPSNVQAFFCMFQVMQYQFLQMIETLVYNNISTIHIEPSGNVCIGSVRTKAPPNYDRFKQTIVIFPTILLGDNNNLGRQQPLEIGQVRLHPAVASRFRNKVSQDLHRFPINSRSSIQRDQMVCHSIAQVGMGLPLLDWPEVCNVDRPYSIAWCTMLASLIQTIWRKAFKLV